MQRKLEEALAMRQEAEAKQVLAEKALQDYIATGGVQGKVPNFFICNSLKKIDIEGYHNNELIVHLPHR